jgi:PAS domain S-box-containing protein
MSAIQTRPESSRQPEPDQSSFDLVTQIEFLKSRIAQLEVIFNNVPEAVIVTDQDGRWIHLNRVAEHFLGRPPTAVDPETWPETFGFFLDDSKTYYPGKSMPLVRALRGETVQAEEMILQPADRPDPVWISMSAQVLTGEDGSLKGAIVVFRDITYRKQVELSREKEVHRVEALYTISRSIAELGNDLPQIMNTVAAHASNFIGDACITTLINPENTRLEIAAVYHPDPAAKALLRELMISTDYDWQEGIVGGVIETGEPLLIPSITLQQLEAISLPEYTKYAQKIGVQSMLIVPIKGRGGVLGTLDLSRDQGGKPYTVEDQSFVLDIANRTALAIENCRLVDSLKVEISERLSTKLALEQSEERFRSIFQSTALGIKVLDLDGKILETNPAFQAMLGYSEDEITRQHFAKFLHPFDSLLMLRQFDSLIQCEKAEFRLEHRLLHKDGSILWVNATFTGVKQSGSDDCPAFVVGITENITERKRFEKEMAEIKSRLQGNVEMERLRLAQELHDGPMQELYSAIYQMESLRTGLAPQPRAVLESVKHDIQQVLHELRATAKELRPPTIANFGLEKSIRSHADDFREKHPGLKINLSLARDQLLLQEEVRLALFRIYQHSLANVVRHAEASEVSVRFTFDAEEARLEIIDNGVGFDVPTNWIAMTRQGHFGLAGAAERVQALGGKFTVESQSGRGTCVRAVIPIEDIFDGRAEHAIF